MLRVIMSVVVFIVMCTVLNHSSEIAHYTSKNVGKFVLPVLSATEALGQAVRNGESDYMR